MRGFFITGTDTGVGKTAVTGAMAHVLRRRGLDPGVMKPAATGCIRRGAELVAADALFLARMAGVDDALDLICPCRLELPLAPAVAAQLSGERVDLSKMEEAFRLLGSRHRVMLVEGVGGLMVPLSGAFLVEDLAVRFNLPLLVVARPDLGTINHTLLTISRARQRGLSVAGVVVNGLPGEPDAAQRTSPLVIGSLSGVKILGVIPRDGEVDVEAGRPGNLAALAGEHLDWPALLAELEG